MGDADIHEHEFKIQKIIGNEDKWDENSGEKVTKYEIHYPGTIIF